MHAQDRSYVATRRAVNKRSGPIVLGVDFDVLPEQHALLGLSHQQLVPALLGLRGMATPQAASLPT